MDASHQDAGLLFDRWRQAQSPVHIKLISQGLIFQGTGRVADYSHESLQLAGAAWSFTVPVSGASFRFADPREIPIAAVRAAESAKYELGLAVDLPSGDTISLMEIKEPAEAF